MNLWHDLVFDYTLRTVALGSAALGLVSGCLGTFAVLRRQSLLGDAVSHAALPGIVLAFILTGSKTPLILILGAAVAGWAGALLVMLIVGTTILKTDSALGLVLSTFFGFGLVLLSVVQRSAGAGQAGLDRFLFDEAQRTARSGQLTRALGLFRELRSRGEPEEQDVALRGLLAIPRTAREIRATLEERIPEELGEPEGGDRVGVGVAEHVAHVEGARHGRRRGVDGEHQLARCRVVEAVDALGLPAVGPAVFDAVERRLLGDVRHRRPEATDGVPRRTIRPRAGHRRGSLVADEAGRRPVGHRLGRRRRLSEYL